MGNYTVQELSTLIKGCLQKDKKLHSHGIKAGVISFDNVYENNAVLITSALVAATGFKTVAVEKSLLRSIDIPSVPLSSEDSEIISLMVYIIESGINHVIFDIPYGSTATLKTNKKAEQVSKTLEEIGKHFSIRVTSDSYEFLEPLGNGVGLTLELIDVLEVLEHLTDRPADLERRAILLAGKLLDLCYDTEGISQDGTEAALNLLVNKSALKKFLQSIRDRRGNAYISTKTLKNTSIKKDIISTSSGKIDRINNFNLISVLKILGAPTDRLAGVYLHKKTGNEYYENEKMMTFYSNSEYNLKEAVETLHHFPIQF